MGLFDDVAKPSHYQFGAFQAVDVIEAVAATISDNVESVHSSHLLKYALRWPRKGGLKDLYKARWWLDRLISHVEHRTGGVKVPPPPDYDPASVAFRHGDLGKVCGSHTIQPHVEYFALNYGFAPGEVDRPRADQSRHPMHAEAIRAADETPWRLP